MIHNQHFLAAARLILDFFTLIDRRWMSQKDLEGGRLYDKQGICKQFFWKSDKIYRIVLGNIYFFCIQQFNKLAR